MSPKIFIGGVNYNKIGWLIKISRAFIHRFLIYYYARFTNFPGFDLFNQPSDF